MYIKGAEEIDILIACETSGMVREAFNDLGFNAFSCDILPSDVPSNKHYQCDVRELLEEDWDFLAVMHPPCTRLCNSGVRWLKKAPKKLNYWQYPQAVVEAYATMTEEQRLAFMWAELAEGAALFSDCLNADIPHICIENPIMHKHAKKRINNFQSASQTVQPWWFGDPAFKGTGLYLKNLPKLIPTNKLVPPKKGTDEYKKWSYIHTMAPGPDRWKLRSKTFPGIANAFASQWGPYLYQSVTGEQL